MLSKLIKKMESSFCINKYLLLQIAFSQNIISLQFLVQKKLH